MAISAESLASRYIGHYSNIEITRKKSEALLSSKKLVVRDLNIIYFGLYMDMATSFERFLEDLFLGLLTGNVIHSYKTVKPRVVFNSYKTCNKIIKSERRYVDWLPYDYTVKRAKAFFENGKPFVFLSKDDIKVIEKIHKIRNALAHKSKHSLKVFRNDVIGNTRLPLYEQSPVGYLRGLHTRSPIPETRFEELSLSIAEFTRKIAK